MYRVKEAFYTLQGEGAQAGRAAVFCRFSKCNLWNGREQDRATAVCNFCDTDFVGTDGQNGGRFETAEALAAHIRSLWPDAPGRPYVVCTGGEPLLQLDEPLIAAFHAEGFDDRASVFICVANAAHHRDCRRECGHSNGADASCNHRCFSPVFIVFVTDPQKRPPHLVVLWF